MTGDTKSSFGWIQTIYNRPADVTTIYDETARVLWRDNQTVGFVPLTALGNQPVCNTATDRSASNGGEPQ